MITRKSDPIPEAFIEMREVIHASAAYAGAEQETINAALVLVSGMFTRQPYVIRHWTAAALDQIYRAMRNCCRYQLWRRGTSAITLGNLDDADHQDLEFWMIAMAVEGRFAIENDPGPGGELMFRNMDEREAFGCNLPCSAKWNRP